MNLSEFWHGFSSFWQQLVGHITFLLCVLPLFGASMVAASAGLGREIVRRTALTNVLLTAALSVIMVASYDPHRRDEGGEPVVVQMITHLPWIGEEADASGADNAEADTDDVDDAAGEMTAGPIRRAVVSLTLGVDGFSLWPIALTCWSMVAAAWMGADADRERPAAFYTAMLLFESLSIAALAALDGVLFVFCVEASVLPLWYLVGRFGGSERQPAARKLFAFLIAGGSALFAGVVGMAVAAAAGAPDAPVSLISFLVPRMLAQPLVAGWIAAALAIGLWVRAGLFPLHTWYPAAYTAAPVSVCILLTAVVVPLGGYGLARFVLPLATLGSGPVPPVSVAGIVQTVAIAGAVYCGALALAQTDLSRLLAYAGLCQVALAAAGLTSGNSTGVAGGILHLASVGVSTAALAILLGWLDREFTSDDIRSFGGLARGRPWLAILLLLSAFGLIGVPGLSGFPGLLSILWGVAAAPAGDPRLASAAACLLAFFLCAWAIVGMLVRLLFGPDHAPVAFGVRQSHPTDDPVPLFGGSVGRTAPADIGRRELAAVLPLIGVMLWIGIWPRFFTARMTPALDDVFTLTSLEGGW